MSKDSSYQSDRRFSRDDPQVDPSRQVLAALLVDSSRVKRTRPVHQGRSSVVNDGHEPVLGESMEEVLLKELRINDALEVGDGRDLPDDG